MRGRERGLRGLQESGLTVIDGALARKRKEGVKAVGLVCAICDVHEVREIREGSTGRVIAVVPQIWAVAERIAHQPGRALPGNQAGHFGKSVKEKSRPRPEWAFYRKYTEAMLRRYAQVNLQAGRVPSIMGREMFRGKVTSYKVRTFEDLVIFRLDVERCLTRLEEEDQQLLKRIAIQEYTQGEAAGLLRMSLKMCVQRYHEAVDRLTGLFLESKLLEPLMGCQEEAAGSAGARH